MPAVVFSEPQGLHLAARAADGGSADVFVNRSHRSARAVDTARVTIVTGEADGRQLFVEFGAAIATADMPPLFAVGEKGATELLNYRVDGRYMIVDRLFDRAELRLGSGRGAKAVRIERETPRPRGRS